MKMEIKEFDYDLESGFAWIQVESKDDKMMTVQCCLQASEEGGLHLKEIDKDDCGHNWGCCADANEAAFKYWGENRCMKALFSAAEEAGIEAV